MSEINRLQQLAGINEIKVNKPGITGDEISLIYANLQGTRKPYNIDECERFDINNLSKQYLEDIGFDEEWIEEQGDDNPLLNKNKIIQSLKTQHLPIQTINKKQADNLDDVYISSHYPYTLLKFQNRYFFVDSQGYNYPRYVMEIIGL